MFHIWLNVVNSHLEHINIFKCKVSVLLLDVYLREALFLRMWITNLFWKHIEIAKNKNDSLSQYSQYFRFWKFQGAWLFWLKSVWCVVQYVLETNDHFSPQEQSDHPWSRGPVQRGDKEDQVVDQRTERMSSKNDHRVTNRTSRRNSTMYGQE